MPVSVTRPGDPYTFGRLDDISSSDYRALLIAAQERRKRIAPHSTIHDIRIVGSTEAKVLVYTGNGAFYVFLQKRASTWHVTGTRRLDPNDILI
jgi:hypothetical protein